MTFILDEPAQGQAIRQAANRGCGLTRNLLLPETSGLPVRDPSPPQELTVAHQQPTGGQMSSPWGAPQTYYRPPVTPQRSGAPAIIGFILSLIAFFCGWVPFLGLVLGVAALALSIWAMGTQVLKGLAVAGIILSVLATRTSLVTTGMFALALLGSSDTTTSASPPKSYSPEDFLEVDERTLALIAKDPGSHAGETFQLYGWVSQFDPTSGKCTMRLSVSAQKQDSLFSYEHNSLAYSGDGDENCPLLDDVVEDDELKLNVVLVGEKTYSSLGGGTTVPYFEIIDVEVL